MRSENNLLGVSDHQAMRLLTAFTSLTLGAQDVQRRPPLIFPDGTVVYWGQGGTGAPEKGLLDYCNPAFGTDIVVPAFLCDYGNGNVIPRGTIGDCSITTILELQNCDSIATAIETCRANGIKVLLFLGDAASSASHRRPRRRR